MTTIPQHVLVERVSAIVGRVFGVSAPDAHADLLAFEGFDSLTVAQLIDEIEDTWHCELPAEAIVPETFTTPAALAAVVACAITSPLVAGVSPR